MTSTYLQDEAYVDVYLAHHMANKEYPYRIQQVKEASPTTAEKATKHILDSSIGKDYSNADVVEKAEHLGVKIVVPCDVIGDHEATVEQVLDMCERIAGTDMRLVVPIQGDSPDEYVDNTAEMRSILADHGYESLVDRYAIGGVKDASGDQQRAIARAVATEHDDLRWHLFGAGMSTEWVRFIRENPALLTSIDMATPVYASKSNELILYDMDRIDFEKPRGKYVTFTNGRLIEFMLTEFNYLISPGPNEDELAEIVYDES